jgi:hypothetical protein
MDRLWVNDKLGQLMGQNCFVVHQPEKPIYTVELKRTFAEGRGIPVNCSLEMAFLAILTHFVSGLNQFLSA